MRSLRPATTSRSAACHLSLALPTSWVIPSQWANEPPPHASAKERARSPVSRRWSERACQVEFFVLGEWATRGHSRSTSGMLDSCTGLDSLVDHVARRPDTVDALTDYGLSLIH